MCVFRRSSSTLVMTGRSGACSTRSYSSCRSITPPQVNRDTLWRRPVTGGPALTFWHIYTVGSRGAASPLSHLAECLAALMDEARPLRPAEFYLRLTSRCCHRCFLAAPPSSISLLHSASLSASPLSALTLSVSLSFYFFSPSLRVLTCLLRPISLSAAAASSLPAGTPLRSGSAAFLHQSDKQGGEQTRALSTHTSPHVHGRKFE